MDKIVRQEDDLNILYDRLCDIRPNSAGFSIRAESTATFFLELLERYNPSKVADVFRAFVDNNGRYSYDDKYDAIDFIMARAHTFIRKNKDDFDLDELSEKIMEFIDVFNKYPFPYKIAKDFGLEVDRIHKVQSSLNKDINEINNRYNAISTKIDKINYDFIGTISLFVGVIFAVYGGFELCTSVFKYIGKIEFKYLIIALNILGYIELSIISLLVHVIFKINNRSSKDIFVFDVIYFFAMILFISIIYYFVK